MIVRNWFSQFFTFSHYCYSMLIFCLATLSLVLFILYHLNFLLPFYNERSDTTSHTFFQYYFTFMVKPSWKHIGFFNMRVHYGSDVVLDDPALRQADDLMDRRPSSQSETIMTLCPSWKTPNCRLHPDVWTFSC